jgi:hypothetical protein
MGTTLTEQDAENDDDDPSKSFQPAKTLQPGSGHALV